MRELVPDQSLRFQLDPEEAETNQEALQLPTVDMEVVRQAVADFQSTGMLDDNQVNQLDIFFGTALPEEETALADPQTNTHLRAYVQERMASL